MISVEPRGEGGLQIITVQADNNSLRQSRGQSQGIAEQILAERDAGRSWDYDAKERNAMSAQFYRNPDGTGLCRRSALSGS